MAMWRCPHCGTPQAEAARCWVCHRSSTACASCRHFRRSVAAQVGFCGLDRARRPLRGDEIRPCWEARIESDDAPAAFIPRGLPVPAGFADDRTPVRRLEFVEVGIEVRPGSGDARASGRPDHRAAGPEIDAEARVEAAPLAPPETRWSLWGDLET